MELGSDSVVESLSQEENRNIPSGKTPVPAGKHA